MFWQIRHILGGIKSTVKWKAGTVSEEFKYLRLKIMTHISFKLGAFEFRKQNSNWTEM